MAKVKVIQVLSDKEQYSVNIYFIVVLFDINLGVTSCSLLAGRGFPLCQRSFLFTLQK